MRTRKQPLSAHMKIRVVFELHLRMLQKTIRADNFLPNFISHLHQNTKARDFTPLIPSR